MYRYALIFIVLLPNTLAASSPESWKQLDLLSGRACLALSGLASPVLLESKNQFSDAIGIDLRMIQGLDEKGEYKQLLCAYNRRSGHAEVQDAGSWTGPSVQP